MELLSANWSSGRTRTLFAYLLLHRSVPTARPQLAYTLWPDTSDKQAQTNLRTLLFRLRRGLVDGDRFLAVTRGTVQLRTDAPLDMDLFEFERLLATADDARTDNERAQNLAQAVAIYRGDLLPDCYDDWIAPERERLRDLYLHALERLIGHHEEQRHYEAAIGQAQRLLRSDPLHEATYHRLMRLYALNGDRAGALRVYHACVDTLQRELDVEPGVKIEEAYQRLLHRKTTVATKPETRRTRAQLVGRNSEWTTLIEAWRRARGRQAGLELGVANQGSTPNLQSLPAKVAAVLQQRLAQLSPSAQQLVQLAAVIGRTFTFDLLAEICEQNEDAVVDALDEAWRRRIIREDGVNAYDFSHDKLRATAYALLSPVRRRRHHRHVAEALVRRYAGEPNVVSGEDAVA